MKVLLVNKFLYPNGGSETYIFKLGNYLESQGHEVQYFGMEHEGRCVGNRVNAYTSDMDFHNGSKLAKLTYPIKTIYSKEARVQLRKVLDDFCPDVCHLNNFNYQLTPSMILEIVKWRKETGHQCKIVFTAHDYQLVCPNHMLNNPNTHQNCEKCLGSHFMNCVKGKCIHGSTAKSAIGMMEAMFWKLKGTYKYIDTMICCSEFMKNKMDSNPLFAKKTVAMHNFIDKVEWKDVEKKDYVLYFGRFSEEKGIGTLIDKYTYHLGAQVGNLFVMVRNHVEHLSQMSPFMFFDEGSKQRDRFFTGEYLQFVSILDVHHLVTDVIGRFYKEYQRVTTVAKRFTLGTETDKPQFIGNGSERPSLGMKEAKLGFSACIVR